MNAIQTATAVAIVNVFETGSARGQYGGIAIMKGDNGHLSYGRSQASLGSGTLFDLLTDYCSQPNATCAAELLPFLPRFQQRDVSLDTDDAVRKLLKRASDDIVMRQTQDRFFSNRFLTPALQAAQRLGITQPLGQAVVYDSHIQGGWGRLQPKVGAISAARDEQSWIKTYIDVRRKWLLSLNPPLPATVSPHAGVHGSDRGQQLVSQAAHRRSRSHCGGGGSRSVRRRTCPPDASIDDAVTCRTTTFRRCSERSGITPDGVYRPLHRRESRRVGRRRRRLRLWRRAPAR